MSSVVFRTAHEHKKLSVAMATSTTATDTMLAYVIEKPGDKEAKLVHLPIPPLDGPGFCRIKVLRAGVCNTDLELLQGYMGFHGVLGHEFVGVVQEVADEAHKDWVGKRVCGDINVGCDDCGICHDVGKLNLRCPQMSRNHCPNRTVLGILKRNGTMAEYLTLPIRNLHVVPDHVSDEEAVFAEPLAAACRLAEQKLVSGSDRVVMLGDGKLGLMIAEVVGRQYLEHGDKSVPPPLLLGKHSHKLDLVKESGVATKLLSSCFDDEKNELSSDMVGKFDVVVDATGRPQGLQLATKLCRPMGTLILKSTCAASDHFHAAPIVIDELKIVGSRCGPIDEALRLLALKDEEAPVKPLGVTKYITKTFPLSQADEALNFAAEKSTMKVQIVCSEQS